MASEPDAPARRGRIRRWAPRLFLASLFLGIDPGGFNIVSILTAFIGAVVFLLILRAIPGRQPFER